MAFTTINGSFFLKQEGEREHSVIDTVARAGRVMIRRRIKTCTHRMYLKRTDGADDSVRDIDSDEPWWDPVDGQPSNIADSIVAEVDIQYDPFSGEVNETVFADITPVAFSATQILESGTII